MEPEIKIFDNAQLLADGMAEEFYSVVNSYTSNQKNIYIALSGGNTPKQFFDSLALGYTDKINWYYVHFFWVDERCVPPDDNESNYGMTKFHLFDKIKANPANIHRIKGEESPSEEVKRYSNILSQFVPAERNLPRFDMVLLGLGSDGHTASIFPDHIEPLNLDEICRVSVQPVSGQKRITLTESTINNSKHIYFLVSGNEKAKVVSQIINRYPESGGYPAFHIIPTDGTLTWFLDKDSASLLN